MFFYWFKKISVCSYSKPRVIFFCTFYVKSQMSFPVQVLDVKN